MSNIGPFQKNNLATETRLAQAARFRCCLLKEARKDFTQVVIVERKGLFTTEEVTGSSRGKRLIST